MAKKLGSRNSDRTLPSRQWRKEQLSRIPPFPPHQLQDLVQKTTGRVRKADINAEVIKRLRSRTDAQLQELIVALGFKGNEADVWRKAFFQLAMIHHGLGVLEVPKQRPPNKNARVWTAEQNVLLYQMMLTLKAEGLNDRTAILKIANDSERYEKFPTKTQVHRASSTARQVETRAAKLRAQWARVKKTAEPKSILRALVGDYPVNGSLKQKDDWVKDRINFAPPGLVKIKRT